jgi:hypothetical protein
VLKFYETPSNLSAGQGAGNAFHLHPAFRSDFSVRRNRRALNCLLLLPLAPFAARATRVLEGVRDGLTWCQRRVLCQVRHLCPP